MSPLRRCLLGLAFLLASALAAPAEDAPACRGDCNGDLVVDENDLDLGVASLFEPAPAETCPALLGEGATSASVADVLAAVLQRSYTCEENEAPVIAPPAVYRAFTGFEISLPIAAQDPNAPLAYEADDLPDGASFDPTTGLFRWLPEATQANRYYVPIRVSDSGHPPLTSETTLPLRIVPRDSCSIPACDPATGCSATLPPIDQPCCAQGPEPERVAEVVADCPGGAVLMVGRNTDVGFGRMQNCDSLRLIAATQTGVFVRLHFLARCMTTGQILVLRSKLETAERVHTLREDTIVVQTTSSPFAQRLNFALPVNDATMALEGQEANLTITLEDPFTDIEVSETLRLVLTHDRLDDLPDNF